MAADSVKLSEDTEMAECDEGKVVTMMDVLQEQQDFEDDANAVLGGSDDKNCTYNKGYMKRQAIYSCLTCCPEAKQDPTKRAGLCLACSLTCHDKHDLVELYTKRNFRCDCGNPKFPQPCQFTPNKMDLNYDNKYNQNFSGIYCICRRPYPDPQATEEEEMIQCVICEDWLHTKHLDATVPDNENYGEMICKECMEEYDFLHDYSDLIVNTSDKEIIVMDPDLEVTLNETKSKEEHEEKLTNGNTENKDEIVPDSINSVVEEKKEDPDVDMNETKPIETGEREEKQDSTSADDTIKDSITNDVAAKLDQNCESIAETEGEVTASASEQKEDIESKDKTEEKAEPAESKEDKINETEVFNDEAPSENKDSVEPASNESEEKSKNLSEEPEKEEPAKEEPAKEESEKEESTKEESEKEESTKEESEKEESTKEESEKVESTMEEPLKTESSENGDSAKLENKRKRSTDEAEDSASPKKQKPVDPCVRPKGVKRLYKGATFWPENLRPQFCTCGECISMYKDLGVLYLTDPDDTVTAYEALGKEYSDGGSLSQYEKGMQALSSLDRIQQINALTEYNNMRDKLLDFLKSFKERKEVVKEEDIKAFFAGMKPKREPDGVYFCR